MIAKFGKRSFQWTAATLLLTLLVGCSGLTGPQTSSNNQTQNSSTQNQAQSQAGSTAPSNTAADNSKALSYSQSEDLIKSIMEAAKQGKLPDCEFPVKTTTIDSVEAKWGQADSNDYVAAAKGTYATFSSQGFVFGFNKGEQIFEARSYNAEFKQLSLSRIKSVLNSPVYELDTQKEKIIGYVASPNYKLEFVLEKNQGDPLVDHVNVLYPAGTVNSMADDPGRQW